MERPARDKHASLSFREEMRCESVSDEEKKFTDIATRMHEAKKHIEPYKAVFVLVSQFFTIFNIFLLSGFNEADNLERRQLRIHRLLIGTACLPCFG